MEHHLHDAPPLENQLAGQQPVPDTPERIQVNPMIGVGDVYDRALGEYVQMGEYLQAGQGYQPVDSSSMGEYVQLSGAEEELGVDEELGLEEESRWRSGGLKDLGIFPHSTFEIVGRTSPDLDQIRDQFANHLP